MQKNKYKTYHKALKKYWDETLADHIITTDKAGEQKYGINTTGIDLLKKEQKNGADISHANFYMPSPYDMLEEFFEKIRIGSFKHLLDLGCGKGRVLCVAATFGVRKLTGIDFSKELTLAAFENINLTVSRFPKTKFSIFTNDAFYFKIEKDVDCVFMFNPFDDIILSGVLENLEESLAKKTRTMTIIYFNPIDKKMFLDYGYQVIYHSKRMKYLEGIVLQK